MAKSIQKLRAEVKSAAEHVDVLKIKVAEAAVIARTAPKDDKIKTALIAAEARQAVSVATRDMKSLEKELAAAEKIVAKADKQAEKIAEKEAAIRAAMDAKAKRQEYVDERLQAAESDPFLLFEIDWVALGDWFAARAKGRACYVDGAGWGAWTGTHWQFSRKPEAQLQDRVRALYAEKEGEVAVKLLSNPKSAIYILEHAQGALTLSRELFNTFNVAHLVGFQNGTVDLRTGQLMPSDPKHYMTGCIQCDYDETADIDRVLKAFARFWPNDKDTAAMFQTAIGYSMTGEVAAKRMFMMVGNQSSSVKNGDNGKSLVQNALTKMFGTGKGGFGRSVKPAIILDTGDRDANSHDGGKTPLIWRRFVIASEPRPGASIEPGEFNRISGGDMQPARPPHGEESIDFICFASFWMSMNGVPRFKSWDKATKIRLTPFPFNETFHDAGSVPEGGQEKEIGLAEWLASAAGQKALALYSVRGAMTYYAHNDGKAGNFPNSAAVIELRDSILEKANPFYEMFEDWLVFEPGLDTSAPALAQLFKLHLGGVPPKSWQTEVFLNALSGRGVSKEKIKIRGTYYYRGVGLSEKGLETARQFSIKDPVRENGGEIIMMAAE